MGFNWNKYDAQFLEEIVFASDLSDRDKKKATFAVDDHDVDMLANIVNNICTTPDREFVMKYRRIIEQSLLLRYPDQVKDICKVVGITGGTYNEKQKKMCEKAATFTLIRAYVSAMMNINGMNIPMNEYSKFKHTIPIDMNGTKATDIPLYDFQEDAVEKLTDYYVSQNKKRGMLVMPTGSGKTRTSTYFLIKEMVSKGYQVLWICHRHMLINQAADAFYNFAGLAKLSNPDIKKYRISCISGVHQPISAVGKDEIIVASIASICRNKDHLKRILGSKVMIVVDESHHALAPSYDDVIHFVRKCKRDVKLLGVTATPIRANERDSKLLMKQFDDTVVYSIDMNTLITKGILAEPHFSRIGTGENFEQSISDAEAQAIRRRGEIPETLASRMASSKTRNKIITDEYMNNKEKYGKTLIFALDVLHCRLLYEDFKKLGIKVGHIYSGKDDNQKVIQDFKDNKYDVLVNVNIMTEGTDVPDIQTVFLTRPTQSEGLLLQMIGRGMRGEKADKGTKTVNIVDFHDQWSVFNKWLIPEWIIGPVVDDRQFGDVKYIEREYVQYDWKDCMDLYNQIKVEAYEYGKLVATPVGWYTLVDEEGELQRMLVFEDQVQGIVALRKDMESWKEDMYLSYDQIISKYFSYMCNEPFERDIMLLIDNMRTMEIRPQLKILENRKEIDPYYVAHNESYLGKDLFEIASQLYDKYEIARDLYETKQDYLMAVSEAKIYNGKADMHGIKVEELPIEIVKLDRTPCYQLDKLVQEVKDEMFGGSYDGISSITWTDKPYKTYFGIYRYKNNSIQINSILNSKDVPREVIKYLIYHEMLHRDIRKHNKEFRRREHLFKNYEKWDHFLDGEFSQYEINGR